MKPAYKNRPGITLMVYMKNGELKMFPPAVSWDDTRAHVESGGLFVSRETDDTRGRAFWELVGEVDSVTEVYLGLN